MAQQYVSEIHLHHAKPLTIVHSESITEAITFETRAQADDIIRILGKHHYRVIKPRFSEYSYICRIKKHKVR